MSKDKVVLLSHWDCDGAGVSVLSDHVFEVVDRKHQGYAKIRKSLDHLVTQYGKSGNTPVPTIVIADLKIELDDLLYALENFEQVLYYDHHESSEEFVKLTETYPHFECHFSLDYCSTVLLWMDGVKNRGAVTTKYLNAFANIVNTYDLWKIENGRWEQGVLFNDLFWELAMWGFRARFQHGFSGFTEQENGFAERTAQLRTDIVNSAIVEQMESGSQVVVISDAKAMNFVSTLMEGDVFYIIPPAYNAGEPPSNVSVRIKDSDPKFNVNDGISQLGIRYPKMVQSAGGHASAGGITFRPGQSINDMVDFLFEHDREIRGEYCDAGV